MLAMAYLQSDWDNERPRSLAALVRGRVSEG